jgi:hypothetical protein
MESAQSTSASFNGCGDAAIRPPSTRASAGGTLNRYACGAQSLPSLDRALEQDRQEWFVIEQRYDAQRDVGHKGVAVKCRWPTFRRL